MKKKNLLAVLILPILLVTGCSESEKNLSCTLKEEVEGSTMMSTMDMTFKGNIAQDITLNIGIEYDEDASSLSDFFKQVLEDQKVNLEEVGYDVTITSGEYSHKLTAVGTSETLDEDEFTGSYEATRESLEDQGYTCK